MKVQVNKIVMLCAWNILKLLFLSRKNNNFNIFQAHSITIFYLLTQKKYFYKNSLKYQNIYVKI